MSIRQLQPALISESAYTALRTAIASGELRPGDRVIELDIAQRLGVSQAPVREAIKRLVQERLLVAYPHRGTYVPSLTDEEVREVSILRGLLEGFAAKEVALHRSRAELAPLQTVLEAMRAAAARGDSVTVNQKDTEFHEVLCQLSGYQLLYDLWFSLHLRIRTYINSANPNRVEDLPGIVAAHEMLLEALLKGDPALTEQRVLEHVKLVSEFRKGRDETSA
jgi:DNA-binding GntR family transcriptional regulator